MSLWKKVKRDVEEGIKKSLEFVKKESKAEKIRAEKRARAVERREPHRQGADRRAERRRAFTGRGRRSRAAGGPGS